MSGVEPFDPVDAIVDEFVAVTRRWRYDGGCERIEGWFDEPHAAAAGAG